MAKRFQSTRVGAVLCASVYAASVIGGMPAFAQYDDDDVGGYAVVIQNRKFTMGHEITLQAGVLPLDAFYKGVTGTARYTLHFNDFHAWEIAGATYSFNIQTDLQRQLEENFGVRPDARGLERIIGFVESAYVIKPIYGKFSLFNRWLIYSELYFSGGAAVGVWSDFSIRPGPGVGAGLRFFIWDWLSLRFDMRHYALLNGVPVVDPNFAINQHLYLGAGLSFNFSLLGFGSSE